MTAPMSDARLRQLRYDVHPARNYSHSGRVWADMLAEALDEIDRLRTDQSRPLLDLLVREVELWLGARAELARVQEMLNSGHLLVGAKAYVCECEFEMFAALSQIKALRKDQLP